MYGTRQFRFLDKHTKDCRRRTLEFADHSAVSTCSIGYYTNDQHTYSHTVFQHIFGNVTITLPLLECTSWYCSCGERNWMLRRQMKFHQSYTLLSTITIADQTFMFNTLMHTIKQIRSYTIFARMRLIACLCARTSARVHSDPTDKSTSVWCTGCHVHKSTGACICVHRTCWGRWPSLSNKCNH